MKNPSMLVAIALLSGVLACVPPGRGAGDDDDMTPGEFADCVIDGRQDADGDSTVDRAWVLEYDRLGELVLWESDEDADGSIDWVQRRELKGTDLLRREEDEGNDGSLDFVLVQTWHEPGRIATKEEDQDGDGAADLVVIWLYDDDVVVGQTIDEDGDGTVDLVWQIETNLDGQRTRAEGDLGDDGVFDYLQVWQYDVNGDLVREEYDDDVPEDDGFEYVEVTTWDDLQRRESFVIEENPGERDWWGMQFEYVGDTENTARQSFDLSGDGAIDAWWENTWSGDLLDRKKWTEAGSLDVTEVRLRTFDELGRTARRRFYWGDEDKLYQDTTWSYACPEVDVDADPQ